MKIESADLALRAQDFHEALKETAPHGAKEVEYENVLLIGKAAALGMQKGLPFITDIDALKYAAAEPWYLKPRTGQGP